MLHKNFISVISFSLWKFIQTWFMRDNLKEASANVQMGL